MARCRQLTALDHRAVFPQERRYAEAWWEEQLQAQAGAQARTQQALTWPLGTAAPVPSASTAVADMGRAGNEGLVDGCASSSPAGSSWVAAGERAGASARSASLPAALAVTSPLDMSRLPQDVLYPVRPGACGAVLSRGHVHQGRGLHGRDCRTNVLVHGWQTRTHTHTHAHTHTHTYQHMHVQSLKSLNPPCVARPPSRLLGADAAGRQVAGDERPGLPPLVRRGGLPPGGHTDRAGTGARRPAAAGRLACPWSAAWQ